MDVLKCVYFMCVLKLPLVSVTQRARREYPWWFIEGHKNSLSCFDYRSKVGWWQSYKIPVVPFLMR